MKLALTRHRLLITIILGALIVIGWTLLRFWSEKSIFDLVGQQVLASAFLADGFLDASVGATHYILKIFLIYIPFSFLPIDPRASLVLMTLVINVAAYVGIVLALRSILKLFSVYREKLFMIAMLWLAAGAGYIFWIEFVNSRNIEIAAGLWTIALGLSLLKSFSYKKALFFFVIAALTFFMDPLQVYMTGAPLILYAVITAILHNRQQGVWLKLIVFFALTIAAFLFARLTIIVIQAASGISIIGDGSSALGVSVVLAQFIEAIQGQVTANIRIIAGAVEDGGRLRQIVTLLGVVSVVAAWVYYAFRRKFDLNFTIFIAVFVLTIQSVYFLSGQSLNGDTSRYLIMMAPLVVLLIASLPKERITQAAMIILSIGVIANVTYLAASLVKEWPGRFQQDSSLAVVAELVSQNQDTKFYASMDTALPAMYFYPDSKILPLECSQGRLIRAATFYPASSFDAVQSVEHSRVAIIFDSGSSITNFPNVCTKDDVISLLGPPQEFGVLATGQEVIYYEKGKVAY